MQNSFKISLNVKSSGLLPVPPMEDILNLGIIRIVEQEEDSA